jgi:hypothetical protein
MKWLIILSIIILIITSFHSYKYINNHIDMTNFRINHKDIETIDASTLDNESHPLIMTYIEDDTLEYNITRYGVYSPLSVFKQFDNKKCEDFHQYITHNYPLFYIKPTNDISITITPQDYVNSDISNVPSVTMKIHPYDIVYIPRFCYWKVSCDKPDSNIEIFHSHTPISWLLSRFYKNTYNE